MKYNNNNIININDIIMCNVVIILMCNNEIW